MASARESRLCGGGASRLERRQAVGCRETAGAPTRGRGHQGAAMDAEARRAAKLRLIVGLRQGQPWRDAAAAAGLRIGRTTAYRLRQRAALEDEAALVDGRHGHPSKVRESVRA